MSRDLQELLAAAMSNRPRNNAVRDCEILKRRATNTEKPMGRPKTVNDTKEGKM